MDWQTTTTEKIVFSVGLLVVIGMVSGYRTAINYTDSIPKGLYFIQEKVPGEGEYTLIKKDSILQYAINRGYIAQGSYIGKKIVGTSGDTVVVSESGVFINGLKQPVSQPKQFGRKNRTMPNGFGTYILSSNEVLILGETSSSFDSRYFGPVGRKFLKGTLVPILTL